MVVGCLGLGGVFLQERWRCFNNGVAVQLHLSEDCEMRKGIAFNLVMCTSRTKKPGGRVRFEDLFVSRQLSKTLAAMTHSGVRASAPLSQARSALLKPP